MVNLNKPSGRGNFRSNSSPAKENVMVQKVRLHTTSDDGPVKETDYMEVALLHDALGLTAKFDENTKEPLTILKARIDVNTPKRYANPDPKKTPLEIWDLEVGRKKGSGDEMGENPIVVLEKATLDKSGDIIASYITIAQRDMESISEMAVANVMMTVLPEEPVGNSGKTKQERRVYFPGEATKVSSIDELKAKIAHVFNANADDPGTPIAAVRILMATTQPTESEPDANGEIHSQYPYQSKVYHIYRPYDEEREKARPSDPEAAAAFDAELSMDYAKQWFTRTRQDDPDTLANGDKIELIEGCLASDDFIVEVIPAMKLTTGQQSLPSAKSNRMGDERMFVYDYEQQLTGRNSVDQNGKKREDFGVAVGHMILGRVVKYLKDKETKAVTVEEGPWFAKKSFTSRAFSPLIFQPRELITPNVPAPVAEAFMEQAVRRKSTRFSNDAEKKDTREHEGRINMDGQDAPDYSGGRMGVGR